LAAEFTNSDLILIRHAPISPGGRLCGRTDALAAPQGHPALGALQNRLADVPTRAVSPAKRCQLTAAALWPGATLPDPDPRLWEQDFGDWDGLPYSDIPDLGEMAQAHTAAHQPPGGESFVQMCARVAPALTEIAQAPGPRAVVAHAGTVRAALSLALNCPHRALGFEIEPMSISVLRVLGPDQFSIRCVNEIAR